MSFKFMPRVSTSSHLCHEPYKSVENQDQISLFKWTISSQTVSFSVSKSHSQLSTTWLSITILSGFLILFLSSFTHPSAIALSRPLPIPMELLQTRWDEEGNLFSLWRLIMTYFELTVSRPFPAPDPSSDLRWSIPPPIWNKHWFLSCCSFQIFFCRFIALLYQRSSSPSNLSNRRRHPWGQVQRIPFDP